MTWLPLPTPADCEERLGLVFPRAAFDTTLSGPFAAWAVAAMTYVDAIVPTVAPLPADATWARPTTVLWMSGEVYARTDPGSRAAWRDAAARRRGSVEELVTSWGLPFRPRYGDNSRETLRDEILPRWADDGAVRIRPGIKTASPLPRWALTAAFAALFDPALTDDDLMDAIENYRNAHMSPGGRIRALTAHQRAQQTHATNVSLPGGEVRQLEPGEASFILKGVIEQWAPIRLTDPVVLTISEPGDKLYTADAATIQRLGIAIDVGNLLPDALLVDIGASPPAFWVVEAVASDGPITEERKRALLAWAKRQRIPEASCHFLTAFGSRNATPARRRLKDLAAGTFAWYADEPTRELAWYEL
jgi:hypothetical protein